MYVRAISMTRVFCVQGGCVTTIELDEAMTEMCRMNPHSAPLFSGDIRQLYGNRRGRRAHSPGRIVR